jgi:hypothetical protein
MFDDVAAKRIFMDLDGRAGLIERWIVAMELPAGR